MMVWGGVELRATLHTFKDGSAREPCEHLRFERFSQWLELDLLEHIGRECVSQEALGLSGTDTSAPHIEKRSLIEPAYRRAVRAFHVVGKNLELRLRIDASCIRKQKIVVALLSISLLRFGMYVHLPVENSMRAAVEYSLVQLVTGTVWGDMLDARLVIDVLRSIDHVQSVQNRFCRISGERGVDVCT